MKKFEICTLLDIVCPKNSDEDKFYQIIEAETEIDAIIKEAVDSVKDSYKEYRKNECLKFKEDIDGLTNHLMSSGHIIHYIKEIKEIKPQIVCICGSSRFCDLMAVIKWNFEKEGNITIGLHYLPEWYMKDKCWNENHHGAEEENVTEIMDSLHFQKIQMADKIFIVNYKGYIGKRTRLEIEYANMLNKPIAYLEDINK